MKIGDMEIRRDQMPSFQLSQMNPDHIDQLFQDVLTRNLTNGAGMPATMQASQATMPTGGM